MHCSLGTPDDMWLFAALLFLQHFLGLVGKIFCMNLRDGFSDSSSIDWRHTFKKPKFNTNQMEEL